MPVWTNIEIRGPDDLRQFNIELNRRIRYYLSNIDVSQILFNLNDIGGTLNLSKGGTGQSLSAPSTDSAMFYDLSEGKVDWLSFGTGFVVDGTTLTYTGVGAGSTATFYKITASTANLADISSTNSATFNTIASSSATFTKMYASSGKFGNSTSYSEFEDDGTLAFIGDATVWEDVNFSADATVVGAAAPGFASFSTSSILIPVLDGGVISEELNGSIEYPHRGKTGSDIIPHVHWVPTSTSTGDVEFLLDYWLIKSGETVVNGTISAIDTTTGAAWTERRFPIGTISSTGIMLGTQCLFRLYRVPGSSDDTYPDDVGILTWGFHHEVDTVGSRDITTK